MVNLNERHPVEHIIGFVGVIVFHVLVIWLLVVFLRTPKKEQVDTLPVQVQIVEVSSAAAAPAATQPPAPEMIVPPPPEIEPPPINIEAPPQPKPPPVVKKQTQKKPVEAAPTPAAPSSSQSSQHAQGQSNSTDQGKPDRSAGSRPLNGAQIEYPPDMEAAQKEGRVILSCDVETNGTTSNCHVVSSSGGQSFVQAALKYAASARYRPATKNGVPVKEYGHRYTISFRL